MLERHFYEVMCGICLQGEDAHYALDLMLFDGVSLSLLPHRRAAWVQIEPDRNASSKKRSAPIGYGAASRSGSNGTARQ